MPAPAPVPTLEVELAPDRPPLLLVDPVADAPGWAAAHRESVRGLVAEHGAVLVRGLGLGDTDAVANVFRALADELMTEREAFASRQTVSDRVYSSSTWPANQPMCMHHELSYAADVPGLMLFCCLDAPDAGGATGVADARSVLAALPVALVQRFEREGWQLLRSYNGEIGASVAEAFGTDEPAEVERYCRAHGIEPEWLDSGVLRTRQHRSAVVRHPGTGERCWFNQVAFLNEHTLDAEVRELLLDLYGDGGLPFTTRFGNGDPIGADDVRLINEVYEEHTSREPWQAGDLMLVDNIRTAHSREAYEGSREVLVGLADPVRLGDTWSVGPAAGQVDR